MKILIVNKFHYLKGGSEKYYFKLADLLVSNGHEVAFFSMLDNNNIKTNYPEYFTNAINLSSNNILKAFDIIYSKENKKKIEKVLDEFKPDIVHLNNFQRQLSASIIKPIKDRKIPIIYTAHDIQAICPAILMLDKNNEICEKCMKGKYINCIKNKCIKNSSLKSILGAIEARYYRIKKIYKKQIDCIIVPSNFVKGKLIQDGIDENKIKVIHNFIDLDEYDLDINDKGYALYFGRLSKEKGVLNLLEAFKNIKDKKLYIAGTGPEEENIKNIIKNNKLKNIKLLGYLTQKEIKEYISNASFVIVPSICYENCPYSVLESQAIGKAVVGAKIAGIQELIKDKQDGVLYEYNNINELTEKINNLFENSKLRIEMGKKAKEKAKKEYSKDFYYEQLIDIYMKEKNKCLQKN